MFIGEYTYSIDEKKRLSVPVKFRSSLGKKAILTIGLDKCLAIYTLDDWEKERKIIESLPFGQSDARAYSRMRFSKAVDVDLDKMGRVLLPEYLMSYASLKKNVTMVGISNRIEIWDEVKWKEYKDKNEKDVDDMASRLQQMGM